jgi:NADPH-dependent ferric siderophore reductase
MGLVSRFSIADFVARHGRDASVSQVTWISPSIVRLRLAGPALRGLRLDPGDKVKLRVAEGVLRSYTPFAYDPDDGRFDLTLFDHGDGAAARWGRTAHLGTATTVVGPKSSLGLAEGRDWAVFLGDESTLGLWRALADGLGPRAHVTGAVELDAVDLDAPAALDLPLDPVIRADRGDALSRWLATHAKPEGDGAYYLSGQADTVRRLRQQLLDAGTHPRRIQLKPYWGKKRRR